jgi:hypothetical protein
MHISYKYALWNVNKQFIPILDGNKKFKNAQKRKIGKPTNLKFWEQ